MNDLVAMELAPRLNCFTRNMRIIGAALIAIAASAIVVVAGATLVVAGIAAIAGAIAVNFVPVAVRRLALHKQRALTSLAEVFSEETVREDERQEGERVALLETQYQKNRAELEGAQEEVHAQLEVATVDERQMLIAQIAELQAVINSAEIALRQRKTDLEELKRVNRLYVAFARAGAALKKSHEAVRNSEQLQRVETARASIKTRMREQMAGQTVQAMNAELQRKPHLLRDAQLVRARGIRPQSKSVRPSAKVQ